MGEGDVMKVKLLRNTVVNGEAMAAGKTVDVPDADGRYLIALKKAVPAAESPAKKRETTTSKKAQRREKR